MLLFISRDRDAFTPDLVELLARLAENVSFALDNFDRAEEKARTEEQKERLTRMFAALSATNEAIMRAKIPRRTVRAGLRGAAACGGKFTSTTIALAEPRQRVFCGSSLRPDQTANDAEASGFRSIAAHPEGRGLDRNRVPDESSPASAMII